MKASQWYEDYKYNLRIFKVKLLILFCSAIPIAIRINWFTICSRWILLHFLLCIDSSHLNAQNLDSKGTLCQLILGEKFFSHFLNITWI